MNKQQIQDLLQSEHFCSHLALSATVYPGSRWVPCCKSNGETFVSVPLTQMTLQEYKSDQKFQSIKSDLANQTQNEFCRVCKDVEAAGGQSDRQSNNANWLRIISEQDLWQEFDQWYQSEQAGQHGAWHWYLFLDNQCQARCVMCDPVFSTALEKEYGILGWKQIQFAKDRSQDLTVNDPVRVVEEFKKHASQAKILQLLGGEPTLSQDGLDLLQWLVDQGFSQHMILKINTNGIKIPRKWLDVCQNFKQCQWSVSVDALGDLNHWIRYPTPWKNVETSIAELKQHGFFIMIKTTVHALNVHYIPEVYDWAKQQELLLHITPVFAPAELGLANLNNIQRYALIEKFRSNDAFYQAHGKVLIDYVDSNPCRGQESLLTFIRQLQPHRPVPFDHVNEFFTEKFF